MKELEIIESRETREKLIERVDVLDKVKKVILLPFGDFMTNKQVAKYYEVGEKAITSLVFDNKEEIENNGYYVYKGNELCNSHVISFEEFTKNRANYKFYDDKGNVLSVGGKGIALFTRRAILNVGMLLRDSKIAKEIRTKLRETAEKGINIAYSIENIEYKGNINNLVYSKDGQAITTSKAISEVTGKEHFHILRDIRQEIEKLNDIHNPNLDSDLIINDFKKVEYIAENGQTYIQYELGEMATMQLMLKYSTEFRAMFILAFQKMKQAINNMFKVKVIESVLPQDNRLRQYIYVIKNPLNETIKIGVANDVEKRIKQLQTGAGIELELIYKSMICSNAFSIEKDVHKHFEEYRTFGEWFKINPTIVINFLEQQTFVLKSEFMKYI